MAIYSNSKLSTFEQCKLKYKYKYIDKIKPDIKKSIEAHLGTCVHDSLEWLYKKVMDKNEKKPSIEELITFYAEQWKKNYSEDIAIAKENLTLKDYFDKGVKFLIDYYTTHDPFDENTLELEKKIFLNLDEKKEYKIIGFIDRLVYNEKTKEYEIHDYKTSGSLPSKEKIENDRQLALYSMAIKDLYGKENDISLIWHYLSFNQKIFSKRTKKQLDELRNETIDLIKKIENNDEFEPNPSILCKWCEYRITCPYFDYEKNEIKKDETKNNENSSNKNTEENKKESKIKNEFDKYPTIKKYIKK